MELYPQVSENRRDYSSVTRTVSILSSFSMESTTSWPSITLPNTLCFPSKWGVARCVMKNCEPLVFGPGVGHRQDARDHRV